MELKKHKAIELFFPDMAKAIKENKCPICKKKINQEDFQDELSKKEFGISGMCQSCQNEVFKK